MHWWINSNTEFSILRDNSPYRAQMSECVLGRYRMKMSCKVTSAEGVVRANMWDHIVTIRTSGVVWAWDGLRFTNEKTGLEWDKCHVAKGRVKMAVSSCSSGTATPFLIRLIVFVAIPSSDALLYTLLTLVSPWHPLSLEFPLLPPHFHRSPLGAKYTQ